MNTGLPPRGYQAAGSRRHWRAPHPLFFPESSEWGKDETARGDLVEAETCLVREPMSGCTLPRHLTFGWEFSQHFPHQIRPQACCARGLPPFQALSSQVTSFAVILWVVLSCKATSNMECSYSVLLLGFLEPLLAFPSVSTSPCFMYVSCVFLFKDTLYYV